jgi:hypothetical protein
LDSTRPATPLLIRRNYRLPEAALPTSLPPSRPNSHWRPKNAPKARDRAQAAIFPITGPPRLPDCTVWGSGGGGKMAHSLGRHPERNRGENQPSRQLIGRSFFRDFCLSKVLSYGRLAPAHDRRLGHEKTE